MQESKIQLKIVPSPVGTWRSTYWNWRDNLTLHWGQDTGTDQKLQKYALKVVAILLSHCDVCLLVDHDNLPVNSPKPILRQLANYSALFWPDWWDAPSHSLWSLVPGSGLRKSQESGQVIVRKANPDAVKALLLASLFAVRMDVFLAAIYEMDTGGLMCGYGDKDVFQLAFGLLGVPFWMGPLPRAVLDASRRYLGMLHVDDMGHSLFMHGILKVLGKESTTQLLAAGLKSCRFASTNAASNLTCIAGQSRQSVHIPLDKMVCSRVVLQRAIIDILND